MEFISVIVVIMLVFSALSRVAKVNKNRPGKAPKPEVKQSKPNAEARPFSAPRPAPPRTAFPEQIQTQRRVRAADVSRAGGGAMGVRTYKRNAPTARQMRRAVVMAEVLAKPVSMRGGN